MESNRNLSSIISKILDEGPPGNGDRHAEASPADSAPLHAGPGAPPPAPAVPARHRSSRKLLLGLALSLVVVAGMVVFAGSYTGPRGTGGIAGIASAVRGWVGTSIGTGRDGVLPAGSVSAGAGEQLIQDLQRQQLDILSRLGQLSDTVTALSATVDKSETVNDTIIAGLRQEHRAGIEALEARLTALQQQLARVTGTAATSEPSPAIKPVSSPVKPASPAVKSTTAKVPAPPAEQPATAKLPASPVEQPATAKLPAVGDLAAPGEEWVVNVAASSQEQAMRDMAAKLQGQGIPVERQTFTIEGDLMYRLRVPGFATSAEARSYAGKLDKEFGLRGGWVSRK